MSLHKKVFTTFLPLSIFCNLFCYNCFTICDSNVVEILVIVYNIGIRLVTFLRPSSEMGEVKFCIWGSLGCRGDSSFMSSAHIVPLPTIYSPSPFILFHYLFSLPFYSLPLLFFFALLLFYSSSLYFLYRRYINS